MSGGPSADGRPTRDGARVATAGDGGARRTALVVGALSLVSLAGVAVLPRLVGCLPFVSGPRLTPLLQLKLFFSTVALLLLVALLVVYAGIYRGLPTQFTLALLLFVAALVLYALTTNPLVPLLFGFPPAGLGPFTFLPELFTTLAAAILLHQSLQ